MKFQNTIAFYALIILMTGCKTSDVLVNYDQSLQTDFSKFYTYEFASYAKNQDATYTVNDMVLKERLRNAISFELEARGYERASEDPDFLVNFRVFEESTEMAGYVDVYKDENYWGPMELRKEAIGLVPSAEVRTRENMRMYRFDKGTLLLELVDAESGTLVWKGYASGIMDTYVLDKEEEKIKETVHKIFDVYQYEAGEGA